MEFTDRGERERGERRGLIAFSKAIIVYEAFVSVCVCLCVCLCVCVSVSVYWAFM
jgi:hypothetical protein